METDKLGFSKDSKPFGTVNIAGVNVEIRRICGKNFDRDLFPYFCAYALLKGSSSMREDFLECPTFRHNDWVGVDTAHAFNSEQTEAERLLSSLAQIQSIILKWQEVMGNVQV